MSMTGLDLIIILALLVIFGGIIFFICDYCSKSITTEIEKVSDNVEDLTDRITDTETNKNNSDSSNRKVLKSGSAVMVQMYDSQHDHRTAYECNRCGCVWMCESRYNRFINCFDESNDKNTFIPRIVCPECDCLDIKSLPTLPICKTCLRSYSDYMYPCETLTDPDSYKCETYVEPDSYCSEDMR